LNEPTNYISNIIAPIFQLANILTFIFALSFHTTLSPQWFPPSYSFSALPAWLWLKAQLMLERLAQRKKEVKVDFQLWDSGKQAFLDVALHLRHLE
jgi:hypothetical protein